MPRPDRLEPLDFYKWYWKAWRLSRDVRKLGYIAKGLYRELLDEQWSEGGIPDNLEQLAEICECPVTVMAEAWVKLEPFFDVEEDGLLVNRKLETMRTELDAKRVKLSRAGKQGGKIKLLNLKSNQAIDNQSLAIAEHCTNMSQALVNIEEERREEKSREREEKQQGAKAERKIQKQQIREDVSNLQALAFVLPPWINAEVWKAFEEMRKKIKKPMTDHARKLIIGSLVKFEAQGMKAEDVLNQSIVSGWSGVFELKGEQGAHGGRTNGRRESIDESNEAALQQILGSSGTVAERVSSEPESNGHVPAGAGQGPIVHGEPERQPAALPGRPVGADQGRAGDRVQPGSGGRGPILPFAGAAARAKW